MSLKFIILSIFVLLKCSNAGPITEECTNKPTSCGPDTFCFRNSKNYAGCQKSCPNGWECNNGDVSCDIPVKDMLNEVSQLKHGDVINGFAFNQLCIAQHGCQNKHSLDNPSWFDNILQAFIRPYIEKNGNWSSVIDHCHGTFSHIPIVGKYLCEQKMADYHISVDLKHAVAINGCGTQHDWDIIGKFIVDCVKEEHIGVPFGENYAISEVFRLRNLVRKNCITARSENGLQTVF